MLEIIFNWLKVIIFPIFNPVILQNCKPSVKHKTSIQIFGKHIVFQYNSRKTFEKSLKDQPLLSNKIMI